LKKKLIVVLGKWHYGEPFTHLGRISTSIADIAKNRERVALVVFTGGEDVHPSFYGGRDCGISQTNKQRDSYEIVIFNYCLRNGIKMAGICRGIQFLNVMAGGFMYQHVTGHAIYGFHGIMYPAISKRLSNPIRRRIARHFCGGHEVIYPELDKTVLVTSTHHQLIGLAKSSISIAHTDGNISQKYIGPQGNVVSPPIEELEAAVFPKINALGVQFHPESMRDSLPGKVLYRIMVEDFINLPMGDFITKYGYDYKEKNENGRQIQTAKSG